MSVPNMSESVTGLCGNVRNRAMWHAEELQAQLKYAQCGEDAAEHLAQRRHATCEWLEADNMQLQEAHAYCARQEFKALQSSRDAWNLVSSAEECLMKEMRLAHKWQSEYAECEYQRHHNIPPIVRDEFQSHGLPIIVEPDEQCRECATLRRLVFAEMEAEYLHNRTKAPSIWHTDKSDSSVNSGVQETYSGFHHDALQRAWIGDPVVLLRPVLVPHVDHHDDHEELEVQSIYSV